MTTKHFESSGRLNHPQEKGAIPGQGPGYPGAEETPSVKLWIAGTRPAMTMMGWNKVISARSERGEIVPHPPIAFAMGPSLSRRERSITTPRPRQLQ